MTHADNSAVTWSVNGGSTYGTITPEGLYTAPPVPPFNETATVTARSVEDAAGMASATITIRPPTGTPLERTTLTRLGTSGYTLAQISDQAR